ncbi:MAG: hypothetical protein AAF585_20845 [Verrucomicrobiota bacterium]
MIRTIYIGFAVVLMVSCRSTNDIDPDAQLLTDLNNDGLIDESDQEGIEYLFVGDVEEVVLGSNLNVGEFWLEHPTIESLPIFKTEKCEDSVPLTKDNRFSISESNPLPQRIYIKSDEIDESEISGFLTLVARVGRRTYELARIELAIVSEFGASHYFHAAQDSILENNSRFHVRDWENPDGGVEFQGAIRDRPTIRIVSMLESKTTMTPYYAYPNREEGIQAVSESEFGQTQHVIINGNQTGYDPNPPVLPEGATKPMTNLCHGRIVIDGRIQTPPSDDRITPPGSPRFGSNLAGPLGNYIGQANDGEFVFHGGVVPDDHGLKSAMGGLSTNYALRDEMYYSQVVGKANGVVFTATHVKGVGGMTAFKGAAVKSGVVDKLEGEDSSLDGRGCELLILDGNDATALMYRDTSDQWTGKWYGLHNPSGLAEYYICSYLLFSCERPRTE